MSEPAEVKQRVDRAKKLVAEGIGASGAALPYTHLQRRGAKDLLAAAPVAAYVALAPFLGSAEATAVVNAAY